MSSILKIAGFLFSLLLALIIVFSFNYGVFENIIIPDPCAYHNRDTTKIFDLFYTMKAWDEGYHPLPTVFNYAVTSAVGLLLGIFLYKRFTRKKTGEPEAGSPGK